MRAPPRRRPSDTRTTTTLLRRGLYERLRHAQANVWPSAPTSGWVRARVALVASCQRATQAAASDAKTPRALWRELTQGRSLVTSTLGAEVARRGELVEAGGSHPIDPLPEQRGPNAGMLKSRGRPSSPDNESPPRQAAAPPRLAVPPRRATSPPRHAASLIAALLSVAAAAAFAAAAPVATAESPVRQGQTVRLDARA